MHSGVVHGSAKMGKKNLNSSVPKGVHPLLRLTMPDLQQNTTLLSRCEVRG